MDFSRRIDISLLDSSRELNLKYGLGFFINSHDIYILSMARIACVLFVGWSNLVWADKNVVSQAHCNEAAWRNPQKCSNYIFNMKFDRPRSFYRRFLFGSWNSIFCGKSLHNKMAWLFMAVCRARGLVFPTFPSREGATKNFGLVVPRDPRSRL